MPRAGEETSTLPTLNPLAVRVARRHARETTVGPEAAPPAMIECRPGVALTAPELKTLVEPYLGRIDDLFFYVAPESPGVVRWVAVMVSNELVGGTVVVHVNVTDGAVETWAAVALDEPIDPFASRVAVEYQRRRHGLERVEDDAEEAAEEERAIVEPARSGRAKGR